MTHRRTINLRLLVPIFRVAKADEAGEGESCKFFLIIFIEKWKWKQTWKANVKKKWKSLADEAGEGKSWEVLLF